jgi:hypothetical protein
VPERRPLQRPWWLLPLGRVDARWWIPVALAVFVADYFIGPDPVFPVLYCFAIFPCAWYSGARAGLIFAAVVPLVHVLFLFTAWAPTDAFTIAATFFRGMVVALITLWVARFADHEREVERHVEKLEGLLPICAFCKSIRNGKGEWEKLEVYISDHTEAQFSHGFCPECRKIHYPDLEIA